MATQQGQSSNLTQIMSDFEARTQFIIPCCLSKIEVFSTHLDKVICLKKHTHVCEKPQFRLTHTINQWAKIIINTLWTTFMTFRRYFHPHESREWRTWNTVLVWSENELDSCSLRFWTENKNFTRLHANSWRASANQTSFIPSKANHKKEKGKTYFQISAPGR